MRISYLFLLFTLLSTSCIFSGGDIEEKKIIDPYYLSYSGINHQLIKKEKDANTGKIIIQADIDSIGHFGKYIVGKFESTYFIFNTGKEMFEGKYNAYSDFIQAKINLGLNVAMESTQ